MDTIKAERMDSNLTEAAADIRAGRYAAALERIEFARQLNSEDVPSLTALLNQVPMK